MRAGVRGAIAILALALAANAAGADDLNWIDEGVDTFFNVLEEKGLIGVEAEVLQAYKTYDANPTMPALQAVAGGDLAGELFYKNLSPNIKKYSPTLDLWESGATRARIDRRLANHIKAQPERDRVLASWLKRARDRMLSHYGDAQ